MAFTAPVTRATDFLVTAAVWNTEHVDNINTAIPHVLAYKTADETVSASTTLQNDDHLFFSVGANELWAVRLGMWTSVSSTGHLKVSATFPASTAFSLMTPWAVDSSSVENRFLIQEVTQTEDTLFMASGLNLFHEVEGMIATAGTAGTFQIQWAQAAASGTTTMKKGSYLIGMKIA